MVSELYLNLKSADISAKESILKALFHVILLSNNSVIDHSHGALEADLLKLMCSDTEHISSLAAECLACLRVRMGEEAIGRSIE
jgi:hypothetical protein